MAYDPDPRKKISKEFFESCLYAYHQLGHYSTDEEADIIRLIINAYHQRRRVSRNTFYAARDAVRKVYNLS